MCELSGPRIPFTRRTKHDENQSNLDAIQLHEIRWNYHIWTLLKIRTTSYRKNRCSFGIPVADFPNSFKVIWLIRFDSEFQFKLKGLFLQSISYTILCKFMNAFFPHSQFFDLNIEMVWLFLLFFYSLRTNFDGQKVTLQTAQIEQFFFFFKFFFFFIGKTDINWKTKQPQNKLNEKQRMIVARKQRAC